MMKAKSLAKYYYFGSKTPIMGEILIISLEFKTFYFKSWTK
jgi:hypothetical protein